ncbi:hypothetical protein DFH06DRAFT_1422269 [Mycena polygramma]|nr:hypothetical protein DFH06DRAFT_1422269 [Mycena polygramma]
MFGVFLAMTFFARFESATELLLPCDGITPEASNLLRAFLRILLCSSIFLFWFWPPDLHLAACCRADVCQVHPDTTIGFLAELL